MPVRPPSSARPGTSASDMRPTTSSGGNFAPYDPALEEEEEEFEDDESDDEDVFAFLPPTTAEQEAQRAQIDTNNAPAGGAAAYHHQQEMGGYAAMQYGQPQQGTSPYAVGGAGTAAFQAQYYGQQQLPPHLQRHPQSSFSPLSPFSHSPFANGIAADPSSTSTLEIGRGTTGKSEVSSIEGVDPWRRPGTSYGGSHQAGPSKPGMANNNPYTSAAAGGSEADSRAYAYVPDHNPHSTTATPTTTAATSTTTIPTAVNTTSLPADVASNQHSAYVHPGPALPPPQSPPSPSTDSHPSTGAGMSATGHRGDTYKLRRLTSTNSVVAGDAVSNGVVVEGARRVVQSDDDDDEDYEELGVDGEEARRRRKEVRVSLPGTQAKRSRSRNNRGRGAPSDGTTNPPSTNNPNLDADGTYDDDDATSDTAGSVKDRKLSLTSPTNGTGSNPIADAMDPHSKNSGKRRKRSGKRRSKSGGGTPGAYAGDACAAEAGTDDLGVSTLAYAGAVTTGVQISSRVPGEKRRNPNAQPYYGYAALANANGYDYGTRGSSTRDTGHSHRQPGTAHTTNTHTHTSGTARRNSTSSSFVVSAKRRLDKGDEVEDGYDDGEDADSMSMSGMSGGSIRDNESREGSIK